MVKCLFNRKLAGFIVCSTFLFACNNNNDDSKKFSVTGFIKNAPDQKIYLEELFFSQKDPEVVDTAEIKNGKFTVTALAAEEGLYRLRMEKNNAGFILVNDKKIIPFTADYDNLSLKDFSFNSPANALLKNFIINIDSQRNYLQQRSVLLNQKNPDQNDSAFTAAKKDFEEKENAFKNYIISYIDSSSDPIITLFALGYTRGIEPGKLQKPVANLISRFPNNQAVAAVVTEFNQVIARDNSKPHQGGMAPDINMPDTAGKPFALSMLRGKYVLVDFWASWCGPCRGENPNVVNAYNAFKDKNFTVLGVSLDKEKQAWLNAIKADNLAWYHMSDLKYWESAAVGLYGLEGIPYNVLVDPQGKILAVNLRGEALHSKLAEMIK